MIDKAAHSVYCGQSDQIVALDGGYCRACGTEIDEEDRHHTEVTPEVLGRKGYTRTPLPEEEVEGGG